MPRLQFLLFLSKRYICLGSICFKKNSDFKTKKSPFLDSSTITVLFQPVDSVEGNASRYSICYNRIISKRFERNLINTTQNATIQYHFWRKYMNTDNSKDKYFDDLFIRYLYPNLPCCLSFTRILIMFQYTFCPTCFAIHVLSAQRPFTVSPGTACGVSRTANMSLPLSLAWKILPFTINLDSLLKRYFPTASSIYFLAGRLRNLHHY